jgi:hypothetical protein
MSSTPDIYPTDYTVFVHYYWNYNSASFNNFYVQNPSKSWEPVLQMYLGRVNNTITDWSQCDRQYDPADLTRRLLFKYVTDSGAYRVLRGRVVGGSGESQKPTKYSLTFRNIETDCH